MGRFSASGTGSGRPLSRIELMSKRKRSRKGGVCAISVCGITLGPIELFFIAAIVLILGAEVRLLSMSEEDHAEAVLGKHAHVVSDTIEVDFSRSQKSALRLLQKKKSNTDPPKRGPRS